LITRREPSACYEQLFAYVYRGLNTIASVIDTSYERKIERYSPELSGVHLGRIHVVKQRVDALAACCRGEGHGLKSASSFAFFLKKIVDDPELARVNKHHRFPRCLRLLFSLHLLRTG